MFFFQEDQSEGSYICSMDALFGLPRKKAAGCSHRGALHRDLFFCEQPPVDEYVACSEQRKRDVPSVRLFEQYTLSDFGLLACRHVMTFWLVVCSGVLAGTRHLMKQQFLATVVAMNFQESSST